MDRATQLKVTALELVATLERLLHWRPQIEEAMDRTMGTHSFDDIVEMVAQGELQSRFWDDAFILTKVVTFPKVRHYHIFIAGGNMHTIIGDTPALKENARAAKCDRITISGRVGWLRALKDTEAFHVSTIMAMEVNDGIPVATGQRDQNQPEDLAGRGELCGHANGFRGPEPVGHGVSGPPNGGG